MTPDDSSKAARLYELLLGRAGQKEQLQSLLDGSESYAEFRVLLLRECKDLEGLSAVAAAWGRQLATLRVVTDDRKVMHDLEVLSLKQAEVEKLLKANEATLLAKLRAVDASAGELAELSAKVRDIRVAISEYRHRVSELATRAAAVENSNDIARPGN
jgi:hypothetical protein